jgi:hypothetical protein
VDTLLIKDSVLSTSVGEFILSGNDANLLRGIILSGGTGSFTLTGIDATLSRTRVLTAGVGEFILTGNNTGLIYSNAAIIPFHFQLYSPSSVRRYPNPLRDL